MSVAAVLMPVAHLVVTAADKTPEANDVKAGWTAFVIFLLLAAAVVVLGFSLVKQLRRAQAAKDAGVYGDAVDNGDSDGDGDGDAAGGGGSGTARPENHSAS